jgi:microcystin-dependent protein
MAEPFVGEIRVFAGNFAPAGWAFCDGLLLAIAQFEALFNLIGTTYGGDGQTTFALPDLRGCVVIHQGTESGGNSYVIGEKGGVETVTLTTPELPAHNHGVLGTATAATTPNPGPSVAMAATPTGESIYDGNTLNQVSLATSAITTAGGDQPHDNLQPFVAISYIISLFGIFPSQT